MKKNGIITMVKYIVVTSNVIPKIKGDERYFPVVWYFRFFLFVFGRAPEYLKIAVSHFVIERLSTDSCKTKTKVIT